MIEQAVERENTCLFSTDRHRKSFYQMLFVAKHRKQLLLTITECTAVSNHPAAQYLVFITHAKHEVNPYCLSGFYGKLLFLCTDHLFRHRVKENHAHCTDLQLSGHIGNRSSNRRLISDTNKTGKIGSQHKFFARSSFTIQCTRQHSFRMRISAEVPTGQTLGHSERKGNFSLLISTELRVEESCFRQIGTQVGRGFREGFLFNISCRIHCNFHCSIRSYSSNHFHFPFCSICICTSNTYSPR